MPFDGTSSPKIEARLRLIEALEQESPIKGFRWKFDNWYGKDWKNGQECGSVGCACGLAQHIGIVKNLIRTSDEENIDISTVVGRAIGIHHRTAAGIFNPDDVKRTYGVEYHSDVTPQMVAMKLRALKI